MKRVKRFPHTKAHDVTPDNIPNADALRFSATLSACYTCQSPKTRKFSAHDHVLKHLTFKTGKARDQFTT